MMQLKISLAQLSFNFGDVDHNFTRATDWIREASRSGSDLILLPELWSSGYDLENWKRYADPLHQGSFQKIAVLARKYNIAIGGSLLELNNGKAFNTFTLFGKKGELLGVYRKIHRFRLLNEEKWLGAGDEIVTAKSPWGCLGLTICYDLRFPEMFTKITSSGSRLILIVAEWPEKRIAHWTKLLQARAIENQIFVAGVNKVGESMGVKLGGHSAIIDPWGVPIVEGDDVEILLSAEVNLLESDKARSHIPVFKDRRPDIYYRGEEKNYTIQKSPDNSE